MKRSFNWDDAAWGDLMPQRPASGSTPGGGGALASTSSQMAPNLAQSPASRQSIWPDDLPHQYQFSDDIKALEDSLSIQDASILDNLNQPWDELSTPMEELVPKRPVSQTGGLKTGVSQKMTFQKMSPSTAPKPVLTGGSVERDHQASRHAERPVGIPARPVADPMFTARPEGNPYFEAAAFEREMRYELEEAFQEPLQEMLKKPMTPPLAPELQASVDQMPDSLEWLPEPMTPTVSKMQQSLQPVRRMRSVASQSTGPSTGPSAQPLSGVASLAYAAEHSMDEAAILNRFTSRVAEAVIQKISDEGFVHQILAVNELKRDNEILAAQIRRMLQEKARYEAELRRKDEALNQYKHLFGSLFIKMDHQ